MPRHPPRAGADGIQECHRHDLPFCRSTKEADRVLEVMAADGLKRGDDGLQVYVMCEIPSSVFLARAFTERFDGFSIGSNDMSQLTLGVDRDSTDLANLFDEQDETVKWIIQTVIADACKAGAKVGLCRQAPRDHPEFAECLVACGIDSMSVTPETNADIDNRVSGAFAASISNRLTWRAFPRRRRMTAASLPAKRSATSTTAPRL